MADEQDTETIIEKGEYKRIQPNINIKLTDATSSSSSPFKSKRLIFVDKNSSNTIKLYINLSKEKKRQHFSRINSIFRRTNDY